MGNFEEGVLTLSRLMREGYDVPLCIGDKRSNCLKEFCVVNNLNYADGSMVKEQGFLDMLDYYKPDLLVSNNFLYLLPGYVLNKYKAINLHSSLLPNFKGRNPLVQTILAGEQKAGYTIHYMSPEMDSGNIIIQREIHISDLQSSVDIMRILINYQPQDILKSVELALSNFEGIPILKDGKSLDIENYREILIGIDTLKECSRKLRAFLKPYPLPYVKWSGMRFYVHKAACSTENNKINGVSLKLKDCYLNLLEVSIHGEVGFDSKSFLCNMGIDLIGDGP